MSDIIKMKWNDVTVKVAFSASFMAGLSDRTLNLKIIVGQTVLLPSGFTRGKTIKANADIINTVGGLSRYIKKVIDEAELREEKRRNRTITEQMDFGL